MTSTELAVLATAGLPEKIEYATQLAKSELLPRQYRDKPANILLVMEFGAYLGLPPVAALRLIHIIDNKPVASAELISGRVRDAGHRLRVRYDPEARAAACSIWRSDDPTFEFHAEWTWERASHVRDNSGQALTQKANWRNYYPAMLKWRAVTECARDACPEILLGVSYTAEELGAHEIADDEADNLGVMTRHQRVEHERLRRMGEPPAGAVEKLTAPDPFDPWAADDTDTSAAPGAASQRTGGAAGTEAGQESPAAPTPAGKTALDKLDRLLTRLSLGPDDDIRALQEWVCGAPWTATRQQVATVTSYLEEHLKAAKDDTAAAASAIWAQYHLANPQAGDDSA